MTLRDTGSQFCLKELRTINMQKVANLKVSLHKNYKNKLKILNYYVPKMIKQANHRASKLQQRGA